MDDFSTPSLPGDIAVLKLSHSIEFVPGQVEPACLNTALKNYEDYSVMASGWGTTTVREKQFKTIENKSNKTNLNELLFYSL